MRIDPFTVSSLWISADDEYQNLSGLLDRKSIDCSVSHGAVLASLRLHSYRSSGGVAIGRMLVNLRIPFQVPRTVLDSSTNVRAPRIKRSL